MTDQPTEQLVLITGMRQFQERQDPVCFKGTVKALACDQIEVETQPVTGPPLLMTMRWEATGVYVWQGEQYFVATALDTARDAPKGIPSDD